MANILQMSFSNPFYLNLNVGILIHKFIPNGTIYTATQYYYL